MSSTWALWVSQPIDIRSTPLAAIATAVSGRMPPEASVIMRPSTMRDRLAQGGRVHVVEQHGVEAQRQGFLELRQRIDFELDLHHVADAGAHAFDRLADAAGDGDVVVLDQHRVIEAEAVV